LTVLVGLAIHHSYWSWVSFRRFAESGRAECSSETLDTSQIKKGVRSWQPRSRQEVGDGGLGRLAKGDCRSSDEEKVSRRGGCTSNCWRTSAC